MLCPKIVWSNAGSVVGGAFTSTGVGCLLRVSIDATEELPADLCRSRTPASAEVPVGSAWVRRSTAPVGAALPSALGTPFLVRRLRSVMVPPVPDGG